MWRPTSGQPDQLLALLGRRALFRNGSGGTAFHRLFRHEPPVASVPVDGNGLLRSHLFILRLVTRAALTCVSPRDSLGLCRDIRQRLAGAETRAGVAAPAFFVSVVAESARLSTESQ